jgi:hypothetical protein
MEAGDWQDVTSLPFLRVFVRFIFLIAFWMERLTLFRPEVGRLSSQLFVSKESLNLAKMINLK